MASLPPPSTPLLPPPQPLPAKVIIVRRRGKSESRLDKDIRCLLDAQCFDGRPIIPEKHDRLLAKKTRRETATCLTCPYTQRRAGRG